MNWEAIDAVAELLGALGVSASLLYLAGQIRADREATNINTVHLRQTGIRDTLLTIAGSTHLALAKLSFGVPVWADQRMVTLSDLKTMKL